MKNALIAALALALLLTLWVPLSQAQIQFGNDPATTRPDRPASVASEIPIQGRLTNASGNPLSGSYNMIFKIYDIAVGGSALCQDSLSGVTVNSGLFSVSMYCNASNFDGRALWLGITVGADLEMTPRRQIYNVPYAMSLRPGAIISDTIGSEPLLHIENWGIGGRGLRSYAMASTSANYGVVGASRSPDGFGGYFYNTGGGIGLRGESDTGVALRASGTGTIQSTADSYVFVSGNGLVKPFGDTHYWVIPANGTAQVYGGGTGDKFVYLPITLPGVLYGQDVTVKSITIYYITENNVNYITQTTLNKQVNASSMTTIASETTDRNSTSATSYTLTPSSDNVLSSSQGILSLLLVLHFGNDSNYVGIGGVRLRLGHE